MLSPDSSKIEAILSNQYQQQQQQQKNANICLEFVANCLQLYEIEIIENLFGKLEKIYHFCLYIEAHLLPVSTALLMRRHQLLGWYHYKQHHYMDYDFHLFKN